MTETEERYLSYIKRMTREWNELIEEHYSLKRKYEALQKENERLEKLLTESAGGTTDERKYIQDPKTGLMQGSTSEGGNKSVDKSVGSGIINTKIVNGSVVNPMNKDKYNRMVQGLEKAGIHTIEAKGDDLRYLQSLGAEASYGYGYIMHIGEIPSASAMYEEIIHSTQAKKYGEFKSSDPIELYAREIAANRMLLRNSKAYDFDTDDIADIDRNLAIWERKFKETAGVSYDESNCKREI